MSSKQRSGSRKEKQSRHRCVSPLLGERVTEQAASLLF